MDIYERLRRNKTIVAFCGKKRSGKDTAGDALEGYETIAFADPIKDTCRIVFQFDEEQIDGARKAETDEFWDFTPRWAMQTIGTEMFRDGIDEDVWVKSLLARMDDSEQNKFAVTDVRFPNEVEHLERAGAHMVYIRRPEADPDLNPTKKWIAKRGWLKSLASFFIDFGAEYHASEISLDDHPVTDEPDIVNDGTVQQFRDMVQVYVSAIISQNHKVTEKVPIEASDMKKF